MAKKCGINGRKYEYGGACEDRQSAGVGTSNHVLQPEDEGLTTCRDDFTVNNGTPNLHPQLP